MPAFANSHEQFHKRHGISQDGFDLHHDAPAQDTNGGFAPEGKLLSIIVVTATPTFSGPVLGWSTVGFNQPATTADSENSSSAPSTTAANVVVVSTSTSADVVSSSSAAANLATTLQTSASPAQILVTTVSSIAAITSVPSSATSSNVASAGATSVSADSSQSSGLSGGAKAGIAIVVIVLAAVVAFGAFFLLKMKKRKSQEPASNPFSDNAAATAPMHMRPMTPIAQVEPKAYITPAASTNAPIVSSAGLAAAGLAPAVAMSEKEKAEQPVDNPFAGSPPRRPTADIPAPLRINTPTYPSSLTATGAERAAATAGAGVVATDFAALAAKRLSSKSVKTPVSPASAMSNGPATASGALNVHRIQLDFKPSMDDELELKAGQLVRLLHEYDDGWVCDSLLASCLKP